MKHETDSKRGFFRLGRKPAILLSAVAVIALAIPAVADAKKKGKKAPKVTVMTRNLYLGAPLGGQEAGVTGLFEAENIPEAIDAAGDGWKEFQSTKV